MAGKIERFYGSIVEEALFGKDPDVAEDVMDDKANAEAISRRRRRNEICMSLKRSSIIHRTYIIKNIAEILILCFYIPFNIIFGVDAEQNLQPSTCIINILEFPNLGIHEEGQIYFHCSGKKVHFFLRLLYIQIVTLVLFSSAAWVLWSGASSSEVYQNCSTRLRNIKLTGMWRLSNLMDRNSFSFLICSLSPLGLNQH